MLPLYERLGDTRKPLLKVEFSRVAICGISLPLGAFLYCVFWSVWFDFERSTYTHCDVKNYLPSISAAIGNYEPQRTVWRLAITLHLPIRLVVANMYWQFYKDHIRRNRRLIAQVAFLINVVENFALLSLSLWTSSDNYHMHKNSFITFIICSELYMCLGYILNRHYHKLSATEVKSKSLHYKGLFFIANLIAIAMACYCFARHNSKCEAGVYTFFALFEYIVVLTNMAYNMTAYWDFHGVFLLYDWEKGLYLSNS